jgi:hypothetical protein
MLWLVLVISGLATALPAAFIVHVLVHAAGHLLPGFDGVADRPYLLMVGGIAVTVGLLDAGLAWRKGPRPWSVRSQVPRLWGHESGPWLAAARYGLRLGLGPATILNSWMWWGATVIAGSLPQSETWFAAVVFVVVRATLTVGVSSGVRDGSQMAARMKLVASFESGARLVGMALAVAIGCVAMVGAVS